MTVLSVLALGAPALAQDQQPTQTKDSIVVTGSRIQADGFSAPVPMTVLDTEAIESNAQPNIFTTIAQLPSLQGSSGTQVNTYSTSSGQQGLSAFSLRGVGAIRTLTLLDGQRVVGANVNGTPDISLFPQLLIKRVDVVTGGAGASYGSDAVGGVVNFITDTHFEGIKGNVAGGITTYGDNASVVGQLAYGTSLFNGGAHLTLSTEYQRDEGIGGGEWGLGLAGGRDWFNETASIDTGNTAGGAPQFLVIDRAQSANWAKYGLINGGPLRGIAFDETGSPRQFEYGTDCISGFCQGGDLSGNVSTGRSLQSGLQRFNTYGRFGVNIGSRAELYTTLNFGWVQSNNQPVHGQNKPSLTIQCANPFVPASVQAACADEGITSFSYGTSNAALGNTQVHTDRRQYRGVLGLKGSLDVAGDEWSYDLYVQHGTNKTKVDVSNILLNRRFEQAINAVELNGAIVCADPVARANGCQPLNIIGGQVSEAALRYVQPDFGPYQHTRQTQDVAGVNISGSPFDNWAGPVSFAFGGEWRHEFYTVEADPYGAGFSNTPAGGNYPADPILGADGGNWYAGNYKNGSGAYSVKEAYLETDFPLFASDGAGELRLNAAARITDYSTSGSIWAWKVGGTWDTPIDGLRLRGVTSRDVRAPNLSELYAAPVTITLPNFFDPFTNQSILVIQSTGGNPNLKPEIARNTNLGVALANPGWLPGFNISFDYYNLEIDDAVQSLTANQIVDFCFRNVIPATCQAFDFSNPPGGNTLQVASFNTASIKTSGFDIEASYRWLDPLGLPGSLTLRGLATHVIEFVTDQGLPGTVPTDTAGENLGATPNWKYLAIQSYENDLFSLFVQERWFSDGVFSNNYIECTANCPAFDPATNKRTISSNYMPGALYIDVGGSYNLTENFTAYFKVDNLTDKSPVRNYIFNNPALYDQVGRTYRAGVRFKF
ncbi:TonB-dependent receptor domain-containing protein [Aurantiacibacter xanthus]|nr:TonB-dependent receptor [Aurantiacibacter xanthus]